MNSVVKRLIRTRIGVLSPMRVSSLLSAVDNLYRKDLLETVGIAYCTLYRNSIK